MSIIQQNRLVIKVVGNMNNRYQLPVLFSDHILSKDPAIKVVVFCFPADIYDDLYDRVQKKGLDTECMGGGRILHEAEKKTITVYGYSQVWRSSIVTFTHLLCNGS